MPLATRRRERGASTRGGSARGPSRGLWNESRGTLFTRAIPRCNGGASHHDALNTHADRNNDGVDESSRFGATLGIDGL